MRSVATASSAGLFILLTLLISSESKEAFRYGTSPKTLVSQNGNIQSLLSDLDDMFFEVVYPENISYSFKIRIAKDFGSSFVKSHKNIPLVLAHPINGCSRLTNSHELLGRVVLMIRGECSFLIKTMHAERAGAMATIIYDNDPTSDNFIDMISDNSNIVVNIPAVFMAWKDGYMIKKAIQNSRSRYALVNIPLNLTTHTGGYLKKAPWSFS